MLIMIISMTIFRPKLQIEKARDGRRKSDMNLISKAVEDYLNDNPCYPDEGFLNDCGGDSFRPYLNKIPCDPGTKQPYLYQRPECSKYALYATLTTENLSQQYFESEVVMGNFAVSSPNNPVVAVRTESEPAEEPTTAPTSAPVYRYGCFSGVCEVLGPYQDCDPKYDRADCRGMCSVPANECGGQPTPTPTSAPVPQYGCFSGVCQVLGPYQDCNPRYDGSDCQGMCSNPVYECTTP